MKYCSCCGYSPIRDEASVCPCCGEDVSALLPYDYPIEEEESGFYKDAKARKPKAKKGWKDRPLKLKLALVISGFLVIVGACIALLCLF